MPEPRSVTFAELLQLTKPDPSPAAPGWWICNPAPLGPDAAPLTGHSLTQEDAAATTAFQLVGRGWRVSGIPARPID